MGVCGCGNVGGDRAIRIPPSARDRVIVLGIYPGCRQCSESVGVTLRVYDSPEQANEGAPYLKQERFTPDEYGGDEGHPVELDLLRVEDLVEAARSLRAEEAIGPDDEQYETVCDWLHDVGLVLLQTALRRCADKGRR